ncbi:MAG: hypothetical protein OEZ36_04195 [Spirochaetota bacterium]|nr:hypothetical protein [Spirochaetota bacterium]
MDFPALRAYLAAVADKSNINIPFFQSKNMQIFLNRRGAPYMSVGGFGAVFRYKDSKDKQYAIKVFTRDAPGRAERYAALHNTFKITKFPFMVDFQYVEEGVKVGSKYFPVVVMEWGRGIPINSAISQDLEDDGLLQSNRTFGGNLFSIVKTLQEWNMGHGDLQEGNLVVGNDNSITLIDYDGMFVPALEGKRANEIGLADYQHPARKNAHFGNTIDDFSLLSVLFQLSIITPETWNKLHDDKRLILREADYKDPDKSELIQSGLNSNDPVVQELANLLFYACDTDPLEISAVEKISQSKAIMDWLILPNTTAPNQRYSSIIDQVVTLTDDQVTGYEQNTVTIQSEEEEPQESVKTRSAEEGSWGFLSSLIFEESDNEGGDQEDGAFSRMKKRFMGLIFEEEGSKPGTQSGDPQTQSADPAPAAPVPAVQAPVKATVPPPQPEPKAPVQEDKEAKSAPLPDWMKRRKKKF